MRRVWIAILIAVVGGLGFGQSPAAAAEAVQVVATINGQDVAGASQSNPVRLDPQTAANVDLTITNGSSEALNISSVALSGSVLGLNFFAFQTSVGIVVAPGETQSIDYSLDMSGLDSQATGLINGTLVVNSDGGNAVGQLSTVIDVRGSIISVYGLFGLALAILTVLALLDVALAIARNRLPLNRWRRGMRLLTPGIGIGLVLVFTLSAIRVWVPTTERWLVVAAGFAVGFFILGYLSPTPGPDEDELEEDELEEDELGEDRLERPGAARRTRRLTLPGATRRTLPSADTGRQ